MSKSMCGKFPQRIDAKGRLFIPSKLRDALGSEFYMTPGLEDNCIYIYPEDEWERFMEGLNELNNSKENIRELKRYIRANAVNCTIDSQGRTVVPSEIREDAEIDKEIVIIGNGRKAEIWKAEAWAEKAKSPKETRKMLRAMLEQGDISFPG